MEAEAKRANARPYSSPNQEWSVGSAAAFRGTNPLQPFAGRAAEYPPRTTLLIQRHILPNADVHAESQRQFGRLQSLGGSLPAVFSDTPFECGAHSLVEVLHSASSVYQTAQFTHEKSSLSLRLNSPMASSTSLRVLASMLSVSQCSACARSSLSLSPFR